MENLNEKKIAAYFGMELFDEDLPDEGGGGGGGIGTGGGGGGIKTGGAFSSTGVSFKGGVKTTSSSFLFAITSLLVIIRFFSSSILSSVSMVMLERSRGGNRTPQVFHNNVF